MGCVYWHWPFRSDCRVWRETEQGLEQGGAQCFGTIHGSSRLESMPLGSAEVGVFPVEGVPSAPQLMTAD